MSSNEACNDRTTSAIEDEIVRKGLELGFSNVGFASVRDYPEVLEQARSRPNYGIFTDADDSLIARICRTKTDNPWAKSVVCATIGISAIDYPANLLRSVARMYLSRGYSPLPGTEHRERIDSFADFLEGLGMRVERDQFKMPQRVTCAEAGIITFGNNNFAYTEQDGSFIILVTFLVDRELEPTGRAIRNGCPPDCDICMRACPTGAIGSPGSLDLSRCILFDNIRFSPGAQEAIWDDIGLRIHGCDACQEACPRNQAALERTKEDVELLERIDGEFDLERILALDDSYYEEVVHPIMYNYIKDFDIFRRNAAVALGNTGDASHLPALRKARELTASPDVLKAIDWAIAKLNA